MAGWTQLLARVGSVSQLASATPVTLVEGAANGVRAIEVRTLGGLHATVLPDRGLDIGQASYRGVPLAWISPTGPVHPAFAAGGDWLSSFHGGLLVTAGTQNVGDRCEVDGIRYPLHGALSNIPAREVRREVATGSSSEVVVEGAVRETSVLGVDVELRRRLRFSIEQPLLRIEDAVTNRGGSSVPLMLLYHLNFGWPVVDEGARLFGWPAEVAPRPGDEAAAASLGEHDQFRAPSPGWQSQVFEHLDSEPPPWRTVGIHNPGYAPTGGIAVGVRFRPAELPRLWRWRMFARGTYLTAIEPANCSLAGRAAALRAAEDVVTLEPGEMREFTIVLTVRTGTQAEDLVAGAIDGA